MVSPTAASPLEDRPAITVRDIHFGPQVVGAKHWLGGDPFATAFFNALSVTFPAGERFFMDSVRRFKDELPPKLQAEATAFVTQEALHTREHLVFNKRVTDQGYDISKLEARTKHRLGLARARGPRAQLAVTIALEHFTAILANALLSNPKHLEGAGPEAQAMWRWHAIEEIEHKAVAFDTYMAVHRKSFALTRWFRRSTAMFLATILLFDAIGRNMRDLLAQDGIKGWRALKGSLHYVFVKPGVMRQVFGSYLTYYWPGFHPWKHDDSALVKDAERDLRTLYPKAEAFA